MKVSICIPQFNRIDFLLSSLKTIELQTYENIEISISDDCSTDDTECKILELIPYYKYPIVFRKNAKNEGYDRNYRKCIEIATGDYAVVIGNDDTIYGENSIEYLVKFLKENNYPDIGFCNMIEDHTNNILVERASSTAILGTGPTVAAKHYSCFSFVGGLIYKRPEFLKYNTNKYDSSVYTQIYLGVLMIASGCILFSIKEPLVLKDLLLEGKFRNSYRDRIAKKWKYFKVVDGGLPSVMTVLINGLSDAGTLKQKHILSIFKRIYSVTFPHWIMDYKDNGAYPEAIGLIIGMSPSRNPNYTLLNLYNRVYVYLIFIFISIFALLTPVFFFKIFKAKLYKYFKG